MLFRKSNQVTQQSCRSRKRANRNGAAAVEAALLTPLLLIVALGAIDVGQYILVSQTASNCSRAGARLACRNSTTNVSDIEESVQEYVASTYPTLSECDLDSAVQVDVLNGDGSTIANGDLTAIPSGEMLLIRVQVDFSAVRWMGSIDYWDLSLEPYDTYARRE